MTHLPWYRRPQRRGEILLAAALLAPTVIIMGIVLLYPILRSLIISFQDYDLSRPGDVRPFVGLANYQAVLADPGFWSSVQVTLFFVVLAVALEITLGLACALMLNRQFVGQRWVRMLALLPWAVPPIVNGIMWKWILNPSYGALNGLLLQLGVFSRSRDYIIWLGDPALALVMVVLADVWKETPFIMLLFLAALQTIPGDLYEAARVDGASRWDMLTRITLPMLRPTLFVALALRTIWALKSFDLIYTLTAGGPSGSTSVLGYFSYLRSFISLDLGQGAAVAYLMTIVVLVLVLIYQYFLYRNVDNA